MKIIKEDENVNKLPSLHIESAHTVNNVELKTPVVNLEKTEQNIRIETEPIVHFTPYDTVYDYNTENVSEIRYSPKFSVEERFGAVEPIAPKIVISSDEASELIDSSDLDEPPIQAQSPKVESVDNPLMSTADFTELS